MKNQMAKRIASVLLAGVMLVSLAACGENKKTEEKKKDDSKKSSKKETEIQVFIAASLNTVMTELAKEYNECEDRLQCRQLRNSVDTDRRRI